MTNLAVLCFFAAIVTTVWLVGHLITTAVRHHRGGNR